MEEKIKWFIELLNKNSKCGKYYFIFAEIPNKLVYMKEGGVKDIGVIYEARCWYQDNRDVKETKANRVILKWEGLKTDKNKERFLEQYLNNLFKTTIFIKDSENMKDFNGSIIIYKSTAHLLEKGLIG